MSESISPTHEYLLHHYGPLLTAKHVAEILHTSPNGVRMAMVRKNQPFSLALYQARRQFGRRVYFEARRIAEAIDQDAGGMPAFEQQGETTGSQHPRSCLSLTRAYQPKFP